MRSTLTAWTVALGIVCAQAWAADPAPADAAKAAAPAATKAAQEPAESNKVVRDGVVIEFDPKPIESSKHMEGYFSDIRFRVTEQATGQPVRSLGPAAWLDIGYNLQGQRGAEVKECKDKIGLYMRGAVGIRPMVDLNSYYLLVLNKDASITVVDPVVTMAGKTSTYAIIVLRRPGMDWIKSADEKRLFVTMPIADQVAVVDTDKFVVTNNIPVGKDPTRIVLQPDGRHAWVGNNAVRAQDSGVTVFDTDSLKPLGFVQTGRGHHEIAFTGDSKFAYVTNRDDGTVSVIDVAARKKLKDIKVGTLPLSVAYSSASGSIYAVDGKEGVVSVIDPSRQEIVKRIALKSGLGPLRFSQDGRWGMVVNTKENTVFVIDPSTNESLHAVAVADEPFQITYSRAFAYVRSLSSERVSMINLASLGKDKSPIVNQWSAGAVAPKKAGDLVLADTISAAKTDNSAFVVNPADNTTYFYMEGMNSPMSNYQSFGHIARAATIVDRSLKETEPGIYTAKVRMPAPGRYDVALYLDTPRLLHCFSLTAEENPLLKTGLKRIAVEYDLPSREALAGKEVPVRIKFVDGTNALRPGLKNVAVAYYRAPTSPRERVEAKEVEAGIYEARLTISQAGAYYVFAEAPELELKPDQIGFASLLVKTPKGEGAKPAAAQQAKE